MSSHSEPVLHVGTQLLESNEEINYFFMEGNVIVNLWTLDFIFLCFILSANPDYNDMHRTLAYKDLDCYHQVALPRNKDSKTIYQLSDEEPD